MSPRLPGITDSYTVNQLRWTGFCQRRNRELIYVAQIAGNNKFLCGQVVGMAVVTVGFGMCMQWCFGLDE